MAQLTVRIEDELAGHVKSHAAAVGTSVNSWVVSVLRAALDPELADSESERTRARLARAGLLATPTRAGAAPVPDADRLRRARREAAKGRPLSTFVSDDRD